MIPTFPGVGMSGFGLVNVCNHLEGLVAIITGHENYVKEGRFKDLFL